MRWTTKPSSPGSWLSYPNLAGAIVLLENGGTPTDAITNAQGALSGATPPTWDRPEPTDLRPTLLFTNGASLNSYANFGAVNSFLNLGVNTPMTLIARVFWTGGQGGIAERTGATFGWAWGMTNGNVQMFLKRNSTGDSQGKAVVTPQGGGMTANEWITLAITYEGEIGSNGGSIQAYYNGVIGAGTHAVRSGVGTLTADDTGEFHLGNSIADMPGLGNPTMAGSFGGRIAWILGFHRALSADELKTFNYERNVPTALWERFTSPRRRRFTEAAAAAPLDPWALTVNGVDQSAQIRTVVRTVSLSRPLNERATLRFEFKPGYEAARLADIGWYAEDGVTKLFGGILLRRKRKGVESQERTRVMACQCVDYSIYADWVTVTLEEESATVLALLTILVGPTLLGKYDVTLDPDQVTGPTLTGINWVRKKVKDALRELVDRCPGFVVRFDAYKVLKMFEAGTEASSVNVSDAEPNCQDLEWDDSPEPPATVVTGVFGSASGPEVEHTQSWTADGVETSFSLEGLNVPPLSYGSQSNVCVVDGTPYPMWPLGQAPGGDGIELDPDTDGGTVLFLGTAVSLIPNGAVVSITYLGRYPFTISASIGGSPPAEPEIDKEFTYPDNVGYAAALEIWNQRAAAFGLDPKFFNLTSREHGWFPAYGVTLEKSERGLTETTAVITNVDLVLNSKKEWMYTVAAQEVGEDDSTLQLNRLTLNAWRALLSRRSA